MKMNRKWIAVALLLCLWATACAAQALGLDNPGRYVGDWEGGISYGDARDYYLYITDYSDGVYTMDFDIYRIWGFSGMTALVSEGKPMAIFSTSDEDEYTMMGALDFSEDGIEMYILDSDYPDLPSGTVIQFERAYFD